MIVTAVKQQTDQERVSVFIDGQFAFGLTIEEVQLYGLQTGKEVTDKQVDAIKQNVLYKKARKTALRYLGFRDRTEKEVRQKLVEKEFPAEIIQETLLWLKDINYINDVTYCEKLIRSRQEKKYWGLYRIRQELLQKGIEKHIVESVLDKLPDDEEVRAAALLGKKYGAANDWQDRQKKKAYAYLLRRGYSHGAVMKALQNFERAADNS